MRALLPLAVTGLFIGGAADAHSRWPAKDALEHLGVTAALAAGGYAGASLLFEDRRWRLLCGAGLALGAGAAKELYDLHGPGVASWRDMGWNVAGTGAGLLLSWGVDRLLFGARPQPGLAPPVSASARGVGLAWRF